MTTFNEVTIDDIVDVYLDFRGKTPKKLGMDWGGGDIRALSANNVEKGKINFEKECYLASEKLYQKWMNKGDCKKGDIVLTMEAPLGNIAQIPDGRKYILSQRTILLKTNQERVHNNFLYFVLLDEKFQYELLKNSSGTTATGIQQKRLAKIKVSLPPLPTQRKIARILSTIDGQIEKTEAIITKYQAVKQGILQDLFTRGIDVRTGQLRPRYEDAPALYKESALGMIPKEWEVKRLSNLIKIKHGFAFQGKYFSDEPNGFILLTPGNFHISGGLYFAKNNTKYYRGTFPDEYILKNGDVMNVMTDLTKEMAILGKTVILNRSENILHNQRIGKIQFSDEVDKRFLVDMLNSKFVLDEVKSTATGTTVRHTSPSKICNSLIPFPELTEQGLISKKNQQVHSQIDVERKTLSKLHLLKQGMMQDLLSGKVEVKA